MNKLHEWINTGLIVIVAILVLVGGNQSGQLGNKTVSFWDAASYKVSGTEVISSGRAATLTGATVTTTNTATSTVSLGCIQTTATSTVTPIRFVIGTVSTSTPTFGTGGVGIVAWQFGSCPI